MSRRGVAVTLRLRRTPVEHDLGEEAAAEPRRPEWWRVAEAPDVIDVDEPTYDDEDWWHRD